MSFTSLISFLGAPWIISIFVGGIIFLCWLVSKWTRMSARVEDIPSIKADIGTIKQDVAEIKGNMSAFMQNKTAPAVSQSPLRLSDYGREIFDAIEGEKLLEKYANKVVFPEKSNAYQIQEACRSYVLREFLDDLEPDERTRIELYAYNKGDPIEFPLRVMWISMRDYLLKEKGISTDDVDNHAPEAG